MYIALLCARNDVKSFQRLSHFIFILFIYILKFIYFNWRLITLQYCRVFLPYIDMNQPWVYMCPPSWSPLPHPSPSHPSGLSQCTNLECPVSCIKLGLVIYFTYDNINFNAVISNYPTLAFCHRAQKSDLYICLFCCHAYRVVITIFLNSIYMH